MTGEKEGEEHQYFLGRDRPNIEVPEGMILVPVKRNSLKPQQRTGWELQPAPPKDPGFTVPPELGSQQLLTKEEHEDLLLEKSKQAGIYKSQPTGDKD